MPGETTTTSKRNKKCPLCKKPMAWVEGLLDTDGGRDPTRGRYACPACNIMVKMGESRATLKGRRMAHELTGVHAMDKRITSQSCGVQIGILRERQHCATCENNMGVPCTCNGKCNCLYCRERRDEEE